MKVYLMIHTKECLQSEILALFMDYANNRTQKCFLLNSFRAMNIKIYKICNIKMNIFRKYVYLKLEIEYSNIVQKHFVTLYQLYRVK